MPRYHQVTCCFVMFCSPKTKYMIYRKYSDLMTWNGPKLRTAWFSGTWFPPRLSSFLNLGRFFCKIFFYYSMIVGGVVVFPQENTMKTHTVTSFIVLTLQPLFRDVRAGGIFQTPGKRAHWNIEFGWMVRWWWSVWNKFWSIQLSCKKPVSTMFPVASFDCCRGPWLFRKKGNTIIYHLSEISMALMIHTNLPYAAMRKIARHH